MPAVAALNGYAVLHCKWSLAILAALRTKPRRSLELARVVRGIRHKVLFERLRELEAAGFIVRRERGGYPRVVHYRLQPAARPLRPILAAWQRAGLDWALLEMTLKCAWTCPIVLALEDAPLRPSELPLRLPGLGKRRAFERLAWLEQHGAVARVITQTRPPATSYHLTPTGRKLARAARRYLAISTAEGHASAHATTVRQR